MKSVRPPKGDLTSNVIVKFIEDKVGKPDDKLAEATEKFIRHFRHYLPKSHSSWGRLEIRIRQLMFADDEDPKLWMTKNDTVPENLFEKVPWWLKSSSQMAFVILVPQGPILCIGLAGDAEYGHKGALDRSLAALLLFYLWYNPDELQTELEHSEGWADRRLWLIDGLCGCLRDRSSLGSRTITNLHSEVYANMLKSNTGGTSTRTNSASKAPLATSASVRPRKPSSSDPAIGPEVGKLQGLLQGPSGWLAGEYDKLGKSFVHFLLKEFSKEFSEGSFEESAFHSTTLKRKSQTTGPNEPFLRLKGVRSCLPHSNAITVKQIAVAWKQFIRQQSEIQQPLWSVIERSWKYHKQHRGLLITLFIGLIFQAVLEISVPFALKRTTHEIEAKNAQGLTALAIALAIAVSLSWIGGYLYIRSAMKLTAKCIQGLQTDMHAHLMSINEFTLRAYSKEHISTYFSTDLYVFEVAVMRCFDALKSGVTVIFFFAFILYIDWRISLFVILIQFAIIEIPKGIRTRAQNANPVRLQQGRETLSAAMETVSGQKVLRDFAMEKVRDEQFRSRAESYAEICTELFFCSRFYTEACFLLNVMCNVTLIVVGGYMVIQGWMDLGSLLALFAAVQKVGSSVGNTLQVVPDLIKGLGGIHDIDKLLDVPPMRLDMTRSLRSASVIADASEDPAAKAPLTFQHVTVYAESGVMNKPVVQDVSFALNPSQAVLLVGPNKPPSGMHTIARLILRNEVCSDGVVRYGDRSLREWDNRDWKHIASVITTDKDTYVFGDASIEDNISLWDKSIPFNEVKRCMQEVGLESPMDLASLSIEDRQKIALARAMVRHPRIVIIEEQSNPGFFSSFRQQIASLRSSAMCIRIAQSVDAELLKEADSIIAMVDGRAEYCGPVHSLPKALSDFLSPQSKEVQLLEDGRVGNIYEQISNCALFHRLFRQEPEAPEPEPAPEVTRLKPNPMPASLSWLKLPPVDLDELVSRFQMKTYLPGSEICRQSRPCMAFFIVVTGRVARKRQDERGNSIAFEFLRPGDYFGDKPIMSPDQDVLWDASYEAEEKSLLLTVSVAGLEQICGDHLRRAIRAHLRARKNWRKVQGVFEVIRRHKFTTKRGSVASLPPGKPPTTTTTITVPAVSLKGLSSIFGSSSGAKPTSQPTKDSRAAPPPPLVGSAHPKPSLTSSSGVLGPSSGAQATAQAGDKDRRAGPPAPPPTGGSSPTSPALTASSDLRQPLVPNASLPRSASSRKKPSLLKRVFR